MNPLDHIPEAAEGLGNSLWAKVGEGIDSIMNGIVEGVGNMVGAVVTKAPGAVVGLVAGGAAVAGSLSRGDAPYDEQHINTPSTPSVSQGKDIEAPQVEALAQDVNLPRMSPEAMQALNEIRDNPVHLQSMHADRGDLSNLTPTAAFDGKMREQGIGGIA